MRSNAQMPNEAERLTLATPCPRLALQGYGDKHQGMPLDLAVLFGMFCAVSSILETHNETIRNTDFVAIIASS